MRKRNPNGIEQRPDGQIIDKYGRRYELDLPYFDRLVARGDQRAWYKALKNYGDPDRRPPKKRGPKAKLTMRINYDPYLYPMNKLPPFYYAPDLGPNPGAGFVISTDRPYLVGKVIVAKTEDKLKDFLVQRGIDKHYPIEGFPVTIVPWDSFENHEEVSAIARDFFHRSMAKFYYENKIKGHEKYYQRGEKKV